MDGNGRWAQQRGQPRTFGHRKGADTVETTLRAAQELGVQYLTLFAFSTENWQRPQDEVKELMRLIRFYIQHKLSELHKNNVRLRMIGQRDRLDPGILALIQSAEEVTAQNTGITLQIALSYSGRWDLADTMQRLAGAVQDGALRPADITEQLITDSLSTAGIPDPDLLIRTSGEQRISNFTLWQLAYSECYFSPTLWPDFSKNDLLAAITAYQGRERRYGTLPAPTPPIAQAD